MKKGKLIRELTAKEVAEYIIEINNKQGKGATQQFKRNIQAAPFDYTRIMIERLKPYWVNIYNYSNAGIFARIRIRIKLLFQNRRAECGVPKTVLLQIADCMLPDIRAFFESQEGQEEYFKWKSEKEKYEAEKSRKDSK